MSKRTERRQRRAARQRQQTYIAIGAAVAVIAIVAAILLLTRPGGGASGDYEQTASGLQYRIIEEGTRPRPQPGDTVRVHYTGRLEDGTVFDSSEGREPIEFPLGVGYVIPGWDEGIALLPEGSKAELVIPPDLGYGPQGSQSIPPNATLIFDVELVEVIPAATQ